MSYATPHEAITGWLQSMALNMPDFVWGSGFDTVGSPYYKQVPEPLLERANQVDFFPYMTFDIPDSGVTHTFEFPYNEKFPVDVKVYGLQKHVATCLNPYTVTGPIYQLDTLRQTPMVLNGTNWQCMQFTRESWRLDLDETARAPDQQRVWIGVARYTFWITT